jgi:hypothetical protein
MLPFHFKVRYGFFSRYVFKKIFPHLTHAGYNPVKGVGKFRTRLKSSSVDPHSGFLKGFFAVLWIRIQEGKNDPQTQKKFEKFLEVLF